jgi:hypothetical protein
LNILGEVEYVPGMMSDNANRRAAKVLYDLEMGLWEMDMSSLTYYEE